MSESAGDLLLFAVSARRRMGWQEFGEALAEVSIGRSSVENLPLSARRQRARRALESLGHCDFVFQESSRHVVVAPPVLARLPVAGLPQVVVAGSRSPRALREIGVAARRLGIETSSLRSRDELAPARLCLSAESDEQLASLANTIGVAYQSVPPAIAIADLVQSLASYRESLMWSGEPDLNWPHAEFSVADLAFLPGWVSGLPNRLVSYEDPMTSLRRWRLWKDERWAWVDLNWGRFCVLNASEAQVLTYDRDSRTLLVPAATPPPGLLARALTLCSGTVPARVRRPLASKEEDFDEYVGVPSAIADAVAQKLGQTLILHQGRASN